MMPSRQAKALQAIRNRCTLPEFCRELAYLLQCEQENLECPWSEDNAEHKRFSRAIAALERLAESPDNP